MVMRLSQEEKMARKAIRDAMVAERRAMKKAEMAQKKLAKIEERKQKAEAKKAMKKPRMVKGSQEAKDYMARIRRMRPSLQT
jgi:hypothetical protein